MIISKSLCLHGKKSTGDERRSWFESQKTSSHPFKQTQDVIRIAESEEGQKFSWLPHIKHHKQLVCRRKQHAAQKGSNINFPFSHPSSHSAQWEILPGNIFFQDCFKLYMGTRNGNFLRNKISRCLLTISSDGEFQEIWQLETCTSSLCILPQWHKPTNTM